MDWWGVRHLIDQKAPIGSAWFPIEVPVRDRPLRAFKPSLYGWPDPISASSFLRKSSGFRTTQESEKVSMDQVAQIV